MMDEATGPDAPSVATPMAETKTAETKTADPVAKGERVARRLARAGVCSRRDAEKLIAEGRVAVNGRLLTGPAVVVDAGDIVTVDGKPIAEPEPTRLWRYHKPAGLVTTARDERGRATVFEKLPAEMPRVVSIGRLDLPSEGLLLLTNDGAVARLLELPSTGWIRRYRVRVHGTVDPQRLAALANGVVVDGVAYGPIDATLDRVQGTNAWLSMGLREGKNREVRRVLAHLGLTVTRLIRTAYGPFQLGLLPTGAVEEIPARVIRDQLAGFRNVKTPRRTTTAVAPSGAGEGAARPVPPPRARPPKPRPTRRPGELGSAAEKPFGKPATRSAGKPDAKAPGGKALARQAPGALGPRGQAPGGRSPGGTTQGGTTPGGPTPGGRAPGGRSPGGRSPGGRTPGGRPAGGKPGAPRRRPT